MKFDINKLVRTNIAGLVPYSSARDEYSGKNALFLDANENPFNSPYNRYPDPHQIELKKKIATIKEFSPDQIFLGNGSDEAIDILFRVFCEPAVDNVVSIYPTYGMYEVCADVNNIKFKRVLLRKDFSLDLDAIYHACDEQTKMLFLCSPNNPTSNSFDPAEIISLAENLNILIVVDEAYIDFSRQQSLKNEIKTHKNLVILQTFSKAWGLAGIRLGLALADIKIIELMSRIKYPYNINILTMNLLLQELNNNERVQQWILEILRQRAVLERNLKKFRFVEQIYPSDANFLLVKVRKTKQIYNYLVEKEIVVRDRSNIESCKDSLRITVGSELENLKLLEALMDYQRDFVDSCEI